MTYRVGADVQQADLSAGKIRNNLYETRSVTQMIVIEKGQLR